MTCSNGRIRTRRKHSNRTWPLVRNKCSTSILQLHEENGLQSELWAHHRSCHWCSPGCVWGRSHASRGHAHSEDNQKGTGDRENLLGVGLFYHVSVDVVALDAGFVWPGHFVHWIGR